MLLSFTDKPFAIPLAGLCLGIVSAMLSPPLWVPLILFGVGIVMAFVSSRPSAPGESQSLLLSPEIWLMLISFSIGLASSLLQKPAEYDFENDSLPPYAIGIVEDYRVADKDELEVRIEEFTDLENRRIKDGNLKVSLRCDATSLREGDRIMWIHQLREKRFHRAGDAAYTQTILPEDIYIEGTPGESIPFFTSQNRKMSVILEKSSLSDDASSFLQAVILGDRGSLNEKVYSDFSLLGIAHIIALSGLHLGIIAAIVSLILFPLNTLYEGKIRFIIIIAAIWIYVLLTGMSASVVRAGIMATFYFGAKILQRHNSSLNSMMGAAFFILLISPDSISDAGLQLSFVCVTSLILYSEKCNFIDRRQHPFLYSIVGGIMTSAIAYAGSAALSAYYFHRLPLLAIPLNIILIPIVPALITTGVIHLILLSFGLDLSVLSFAIDGLWGIMKHLTTFSSELSLTHIDVSISALTVSLALLIMIIPAITEGRTLKVKLTSFAISSGLLILSIIFVPGTPMPKGVLISNDSSGNILKIYEGTKNWEVNLSSNGDHEAIDIDGKRIVGIEGPHWPVASTAEETARCSHLIIGHGYKGDFSRLKEVYAPEIVIFMPSLFSLEEEKLMERAEKAGLKCYSVRESGSLFLSSDQ